MRKLNYIINLIIGLVIVFGPLVFLWNDNKFVLKLLITLLWLFITWNIGKKNSNKSLMDKRGTFEYYKYFISLNKKDN